jgi:peptide/nickel transport system permease protein
LIPGDPAQVMLGEHATADQVARFRAVHGLDDPLPMQYLRYVEHIARGDLGRSIKTNLPVMIELAERLPATVELGIAAMLIACSLGIPLGGLAAYRRDSVFDIFAGATTLVGVSIPLFWIGLVASYLFGYRLGWLPPSGRLTVGIELSPISGFNLLDAILTRNSHALGDGLRHLALPALTLSIVPLAIIVRMTRACLRDVLTQDYIRTARAKGLAEHAVIFRHALRNALPIIATMIGLQCGALFSGAILTETIFSWPGMGQLIVDRVLARDYPMVQGVVVAVAILFIVINLLTDICYAYLDPHIRYE